jgi:hypothetical protein
VQEALALVIPGVTFEVVFGLEADEVRLELGLLTGCT